MKLKPIALLAAMALGAGLATAQTATPTQGVSKNEIVIGSIQDLSGPHRRVWQTGSLRHAIACR